MKGTVGQKCCEGLTANYAACPLSTLSSSATGCGSFICYKCGDGICSDGEDQSYCSKDCGCGNGKCEAMENQYNCASDCGKTTCALEYWPCWTSSLPSPYEHDFSPKQCCAGLTCQMGAISGTCMKSTAACGNGKCETGETSTCRQDCRNDEIFTTCGNGRCEWDETVTNCPADCGKSTSCKKEGELFGYLEGDCCAGLLKVYPEGAKTYQTGESQNFQVTCQKPVTYITSNPDKCVMVNIKAVVNKKYVTAENAGAQALIANRDNAAAWETFYIIPLSDGSINIKAAINDKYVVAENAGASPLIANRTVVGPWEKFTISSIVNTNNVAIKALFNNRFVTAENAGAQALIANRDVIGPWETFTIIKTGDCSANICNNGICDTAEGETSITCPADCGNSNQLITCGNGKCETSETVTNCPRTVVLTAPQPEKHPQLQKQVNVVLD